MIKNALCNFRFWPNSRHNYAFSSISKANQVSVQPWLRCNFHQICCWCLFCHFVSNINNENNIDIKHVFSAQNWLFSGGQPVSSQSIGCFLFNQSYKFSVPSFIFLTGWCFFFLLSACQGCIMGGETQPVWKDTWSDMEGNYHSWVLINSTTCMLVPF